MKRTLSILLAALFLVGCGKNYTDVIRFMDKVTLANNMYASAVAEAKNSSDVVKAMENAASQMNAATDLYYDLPERFPELKTMDAVNHPEELTEAYERQKESLERIKMSFADVQKYMTEKEVIEALGKLLEAVNNTQKIVKN